MAATFPLHRFGMQNAEDFSDIHHGDAVDDGLTQLGRVSGMGVVRALAVCLWAWVILMTKTVRGVGHGMRCSVTWSFNSPSDTGAKYAIFPYFSQLHTHSTRRH